jgi:preprotein translocase subunit YajC
MPIINNLKEFSMFEKLAYAAPGPPPQEVSPFLSFLPLLLILVIFYFLLIRPQQKRQRQLQKTIDNLKKGDRIVTAGGIIGTITSIQNDYVVIKVGDNDGTKMEILKSAITGLRQP